MTSEREYIGSCPDNDCDVRFVAATPDDVREHMVAEHGPLCALYVSPRRAVDAE